ncbi:hypothetical protein QL285_038382 [Trifolium repens]|nr:hypothetical protein QL285_038382 [Trifolium repens]
MRNKLDEDLKYDPEIEKTAKALRKQARLEREAVLAASTIQGLSDGEINFSDSETESMGDAVPPPPERTLGDYGQRNNAGDANMGFQPINPVSFDIKNTVFNALKENQYTWDETQCPNLHLEHFYEACGYTVFTVKFGKQR